MDGLFCWAAGSGSRSRRILLGDRGAGREYELLWGGIGCWELDECSWVSTDTLTGCFLTADTYRDVAIALHCLACCVASHCCVRITSTLRIVGTEVRTSESVSLGGGDAVTSPSGTYRALAIVGR